MFEVGVGIQLILWYGIEPFVGFASIRGRWLVRCITKTDQIGTTPAFHKEFAPAFVEKSFRNHSKSGYTGTGSELVYQLQGLRIGWVGTPQDLGLHKQNIRVSEYEEVAVKKAVASHFYFPFFNTGSRLAGGVVQRDEGGCKVYLGAVRVDSGVFFVTGIGKWLTGGGVL